APICPLAGQLNVAAGWALQAATVEALLARGVTPTVYKSVNLPDGVAVNAEAERRYRARGIRRSRPAARARGRIERMRAPRRLAAVVVAAVLGSAVPGRPAAADPAAIARLGRDLDDDRFETRRRAELELEAVGISILA